MDEITAVGLDELFNQMEDRRLLVRSVQFPTALDKSDLIVDFWNAKQVEVSHSAYADNKEEVWTWTPPKG